MANKYTILSQDGGGSWALLQVLALKRLFPGKTNKEILGSFDMVAANSGGSLTMAAMMEKETLDEVLDMFCNEATRKKIFSKLSIWENISAANIARIIGIGPKYKTSRKTQGLFDALPNLGKRTLSQIPAIIGTPSTDYIVMAFDYDKQRATFFRSKLNSNSASALKDDIELAYAIHASSNAPVNFFNEPAQFTYGDFQRRFWDGAVGGYNNPCLVAVVEALANETKLEDIQILSIGTGNNLMPIKGLTHNTNTTKPSLLQDKEKQSLANDIPKMTKSILQEPPDAASYMAHVILGGKATKGSPTKIVRLNPLVQPMWLNNAWHLPEGLSEDEFKKLLDLEMDAVEQSDVKLIKKLGELWLDDKVANQSLRFDACFNAQIGFEKFSEGKSRWTELSEEIA